MDNFSLKKQDFYRYLQLRHYNNHKIKNKDTREASKPFIQLFTEAYESNIKRGVISRLYKSLQNLETPSTKYIQDKWEREGGLTIMDNEWEDICVFQWKITKSHAWKEFRWKNVARYFITPLMKVHQSNGNSQCWRNCGCQAAGHYHVFWECPNIQNYWKDIQDIFNIHIPFDFKIMYLGYIPPELSAIDKYLMDALLAAGKKSPD